MRSTRSGQGPPGLARYYALRLLRLAVCCINEPNSSTDVVLPVVPNAMVTRVLMLILSTLCWQEGWRSAAKMAGLKLTIGGLDCWSVTLCLATSLLQLPLCKFQDVPPLLKNDTAAGVLSCFYIMWCVVCGVLSVVWCVVCVFHVPCSMLHVP